MRVAFVGAGSLSVMAARRLAELGHDVVLVDHDPERIEELAEVLDCGLIRGDGSHPGILQEIGPEETDFLFCLSDSDETNVLGALVGRSLGFGKAIPMVEDPELEPICTELGLDQVLVPDRTGSERICDLVEGRDRPQISAVVRAGLRFFAFLLRDGDGRDVDALGLPEDARVIAYSRGEHSALVKPDTRFEEGDEILVLAAEERLEELQERWGRSAHPARGE